MIRFFTQRALMWVSGGLLLACGALAILLGITIKDRDAKLADLAEARRVVAERDGTIRVLRDGIKAAAETATEQAEGAAVVCQGTGAELFQRGYEVGRSQCPAS